MSPPLAATVKFNGSISHVPVRPTLAVVVTLAVSATLTCAALVSIKPPSPEVGALASKVPATLVVPASMPPVRIIFPFLLLIVLASIMPVLLTMLANRLSLAPALIKTIPPSAWISCLFSAKLLSVL